MIWILIVAVVASAGPRPTLVAPRKFEMRKARVTAVLRLDWTSFAPCVPPGARLLAFQRGRLGVDRDDDLYPDPSGECGGT